MCFKGIVYESFLIKVEFAVCIRLRKKNRTAEKSLRFLSCPILNIAIRI